MIIKGFKILSTRAIMTVSENSATIELKQEGKIISESFESKEMADIRFRSLLNGYLWVWAR